MLAIVIVRVVFANLVPLRSDETPFPLEASSAVVRIGIEIGG